jgi:CheY-like chemotaxis protein
VPPGTPLDLPPRDPHAPEERTATQGAAVRAGSGLVVLLVEDDALIRQSTADMLFDLGHRVVEAGRAIQALESLEAQAVDLLLCDVSLPDVSGVELARRARLLHPGLPVVFATGHSVIDGLEEAGLAGSSLLLAKPFEQDALSDCLAEAARGR